MNRMHAEAPRGPRRSLAEFNPELDQCLSCNPGRPIEYVAVGRGDQAKRPGLALYMQDAWCRRFAEQHLHRRVEAAFMDAPGMRRTGFKRLLAHLAICHNRLLITSRLDRLSVAQTRKLGSLAVRVLSATEPNTRTRMDQARQAEAIRATIHQLFEQKDADGRGK
jgi:hypothetical protein